jgi:hypothetical protein
MTRKKGEKEQKKKKRKKRNIKAGSPRRQQISAALYCPNCHKGD